MIFAVVQMFLLAALAAAFFLPAGPGWAARPMFLGQVALVPIVLGLSLAVWALASMGASTRITPYPRDGAELIEHGVYRYLRHPMYTSTWLVSVGVALRRPYLTVAAAALAVILFYFIKCRYEEGLLLRHFPEYARYRARTLGMFLTRRW